MKKDNAVWPEPGVRTSLSYLPCFLLYVGWRKAQALYRPLLGSQTPQRMYILHLLHEQESMSVSSVASAMELEMAGASGLLSRMDEDGLVERHRSQTNGLKRLYSLTSQGVATYETLSREIDALDLRVLEGLEIGDLRALGNIVRRLKELDCHAPPQQTETGERQVNAGH
jgi:DNA-binding MarR family transcriptional regulator